jgi:predicted Na+-dependent transporter
MDVAAAVMPLAVVGTVVLMPLITPLLIPGASVSSFALAKQLFLTVLLPLAAGVAMNVYASQATVRVFPYVKKLAGLSTAALVVLTVIFYGREFLDVLGSFAIAAQVLWMLIWDETSTAKCAVAWGLFPQWRSHACRICSLSYPGSECAGDATVGNPGAADRLVISGALLRLPGHKGR